MLQDHQQELSKKVTTVLCNYSEMEDKKGLSIILGLKLPVSARIMMRPMRDQSTVTLKELVKLSTLQWKKSCKTQKVLLLNKANDSETVWEKVRWSD